MIGKSDGARRVFRRFGRARSRRRTRAHGLLGALRMLRAWLTFGSLAAARLVAVACRTRLAVAALAATSAAP